VIKGKSIPADEAQLWEADTKEATIKDLAPIAPGIGEIPMGAFIRLVVPCA
jgi:hypothetical protein